MSQDNGSTATAEEIDQSLADAEASAALGAVNAEVDEWNRQLVADAAELRRKADAFEAIAEKEKHVAQAFQTWHRANETAKAKKKAWEALVAELQETIREAREPSPLFVETPKAPEAATPAPTEAPADDSWRCIVLGDALPELSEAIIAKLQKANIWNMGELADWTGADGGRHRLSDLDGIGSATAGKIEEATMAFWTRRGVTGMPLQSPTIAQEASEGGK